MNYQKIYTQIINKAKSEDRKKLKKTDINYVYYETHHVIPKCLGGVDSENNLVLLTAREHFLCHWLLIRMYPSCHSLVAAFNGMCNKKSKRHQYYVPSSRMYQEAKEAFSRNGHSAETKEKLRKPKKDKSKYQNRIVSETTKQKLRKPKPEGFGEKISLSTKGISKSEEHKKAMRKTKSVHNWRRGLTNSYTAEQILKNKLSQPSRRVIHQLDLDGNFICEWDTISDAVKKYGCGVSHCLAGYQTKTKGYKFIYADGNKPADRKGGIKNEKTSK